MQTLHLDNSLNTFISDIESNLDKIFEDKIKFVSNQLKNTNNDKKLNKVMVLPYTKIDNVVEFIVFHDKRYNEWTFLSGYVENNESHLDAANREMDEETFGLLNIDIKNYPNTTFSTSGFCEKNKLLKYEVIFVDVTKLFPNYQSKDIFVSNFQKTVLNTKFSENSIVSFETFETFSKRKNIWCFVQKYIINNFFTHKIVYSI